MKVRIWDYVIVGTGIGGATVGLELAKAGHSVLFCEKGKDQTRVPENLKGNYAEVLQEKLQSQKIDPNEILKRAGRNNEASLIQNRKKSSSKTLFIGQGTGGSSALFGMAFEQFFPEDFRSWPIQYTDLESYYKKANKLFRVKPSPQLTPSSQEFMDHFTKIGLKPYKLPLACDFVPGCKTCQGFLCPKKCKNDSDKVCLQPARSNYQAELLDQCEVVRLKANSSKVTGVLCLYRGKQVELKARKVILAAGALATPKILLNSKSKYWPLGLANKSGLVGRNLMRHYVDIYAVTPKKSKASTELTKQLALNDLYDADGKRLGTLQSFGSTFPAELIIGDIEKDLTDNNKKVLLRFFQAFKPFLKIFIKQYFKNKVLFASIMEDRPVESNQVLVIDRGVNKGQFKIQYQINPSEKKRIQELRKLIKGIFKPYNLLTLPQAENNARIAHACGTCRFGEDPKTSVLDANNKAHGISNLYIVDSSYFPSSGGTNPGLTIAANSLRVAEILINQERGKRKPRKTDGLSLVDNHLLIKLH